MDVILPLPMSDKTLLTGVSDGIDRVHDGVSRDGCDDAIASIIQSNRAGAVDRGGAILRKDAKTPKVEFLGGEGAGTERDNEVEDHRGGKVTEVAVEGKGHAVGAAGGVLVSLYKLLYLRQGGEGRERGPRDLLIIRKKVVVHLMGTGGVGPAGPVSPPKLFNDVGLLLGIGSELVARLLAECEEWGFGGGEDRADLIKGLSAGLQVAKVVLSQGSVSVRSKWRGESRARGPFLKEGGNQGPDRVRVEGAQGGDIDDGRVAVSDSIRQGQRGIGGGKGAEEVNGCGESTDSGLPFTCVIPLLFHEASMSFLGGAFERKIRFEGSQAGMVQP